MSDRPKLTLEQRQLQWKIEELAQKLREAKMKRDWCPSCHMPITREEGVVEQDIQGNDIEGWWYACHKCGWSGEIWYS